MTRTPNVGSYVKTHVEKSNCEQARECAALRPQNQVRITRTVQIVNTPRKSHENGRGKVRSLENKGQITFAEGEFMLCRRIEFGGTMYLTYLEVTAVPTMCLRKES